MLVLRPAPLRAFSRGLRVSAIARSEHLSELPLPGPPPPSGPPTPTTNAFPTHKITGVGRAQGTTQKQNPVLGIHCQSTRNNTTISVTRDNNVVFWTSAGRCGFKGANRASYEAGYQCAKKTFEKMTELLEVRPKPAVDVYFKGFGQGRDAMRSALLAVEGTHLRNFIRSVTDRTPIKIGGPRSQKARRL